MFRAVKLLPMNKTLIGASSERLVIFVFASLEIASLDSSYRWYQRAPHPEIRIDKNRFGALRWVPELARSAQTELPNKTNAGRGK